MKHTFTFFAALLVATCVFAQSPSKLSYQAVIRNPGVGLIANQEVGIRISILQGTVDGTAVYTETQTPTSNGNGLVTFEIGTGVTSDDFSAIDWSDGPYFIKTETDPAGGTDYSITGTSEILSVPYALHASSALNAATAGTITGTITESQVSDLQAYLTAETDPVFGAWDKSSDISITESQISDLQSYLTTEIDPVYTASPASGITATDISNLGNLSGVNSGDQDLSAYATRANVLELNNTTTFTPDADYEPATKKYVDDQISTATGGHYVGELFGGGVVFWVSADGTHGLVASLDDLAPTGAFWGAVATSVTAFSATDGAANTATMLASSPAPGTAAVLCDEYNGGGFSDWYLPSVRELHLLCSLDLLIDDMLDNDGDPNTNGFRQEFASPVAGVYWTSTAFSPDAAYVYRFLEGRLETNTKTVSRGVRAVRAF